MFLLAAEIPQPVFDAWRLKGLVQAELQPAPQACSVSSLRMQDDGHECWLTHCDGASPRVPRSGAVVALAGWVGLGEVGRPGLRASRGFAASEAVVGRLAMGGPPVRAASARCDHGI